MLMNVQVVLIFVSITAPTALDHTYAAVTLAINSVQMDSTVMVGYQCQCAGIYVLASQTLTF